MAKKNDNTPQSNQQSPAPRSRTRTTSFVAFERPDGIYTVNALHALTTPIAQWKTNRVAKKLYPSDAEMLAALRGTPE